MYTIDNCRVRMVRIWYGSAVLKQTALMEDVSSTMRQSIPHLRTKGEA